MMTKTERREIASLLSDLTANGLETEHAKAFLENPPKVDDLIPRLGLSELKPWRWGRRKTRRTGDIMTGYPLTGGARTRYPHRSCALCDGLDWWYDGQDWHCQRCHPWLPGRGALIDMVAIPPRRSRPLAEEDLILEASFVVSGLPGVIKAA